MVQSFYTLQQAAEVLGITEDELKRMAQSREVRAFADGGSWKFRQQDIEELARTREHGSDPDIQLSDSTSFSDSDSDDILDEDAQVMLDALPGDAFTDDDSAKTIIGVKGGGSASDSDVRLLLSDENAAGDSDVRLVGDSSTSLGGGAEDDDAVDLGDDISKAPSDSDIRMTFDDSVVNPSALDDARDSDFGERTEEITLREEDFDLALSGNSASKLTEPQGIIDQSASDDDLDFNFDDDMSTGFKVEGGSDFDLAGFDSDDELPSAKGSTAPVLDDDDLTIPLESIKLQDDSDISLAPDDSDITAGAPDSGINLGRPDDSGISLESADQESSDSEFELSLDSDSETDIFGSDELPAFKDDDDDDQIKVAASDSSETEEVSDSDFELAIDEDFEDDEESGSEVVAIDEDEEEEEPVAAEEDYGEDYEDYEDVAATGEPATLQRGVTAAAASNPPWPGWLAAPLSITAFVLIICGMMMVEVMRNAWSHQTPYTLSGTVIKTVYDLAVSMGLAK